MEVFSSEELESLIKSKLSLLSNLQNYTPQKQIEFSLGEVILQLLKGGKPVIKLLMINFEGQHSIYYDKSSDTKINVRNLKIFNLEVEQNKNDIILSPSDNLRVGEFEDKINLLTFRKRDRYLSIGTDSHWYIMDIFELALMPLKVNVSKAQIEFIVAFFFYDPNEIEIKHEEYRNLLLSSSKFIEKKNKKDENDSKMEKKRNEEVESYPIYFNTFKLNDTELLLSFQFSENSSLNLRNARVKFSPFIKSEKFYSLKIVICFNIVIGKIYLAL
jgi:hypothetical protein